MCGVLGYIHEHDRDDLGVIAGSLLKALQYRGYDSTGAAIQRDGEVTLRKGVGAPSELIHSLGIVELGGRVFCGQVRWATFGAVDEANAQPHVARCKTFLYGAHNGNVTNTDELKAWLVGEGHAVLSDNDGEMVVHTIEHFFAEELQKTEDRASALRRAVVRSHTKLRGSFAAVIVDPVTETMCAIKRGSSLYFGVGSDDKGKFMLASSDLSSVLQHTHQLVPLAGGDFILYGADRFEVRRINGSEEGKILKLEPQRSRLRVQDTALSDEYTSFMQQEIFAQPATSGEVLRMLSGGSDAARAVGELTLSGDDATSLALVLDHLEKAPTGDSVRAEIERLGSHLGDCGVAPRHTEFISSEGVLLAELADAHPEDAALFRLLDAGLEHAHAIELTAALERACDHFENAREVRARIFFVCCGTSFHAAKAAALFFANLAGVDVLPLLPGEFRGQYASSCREGDVFVAISQSGETKDLIDVLDQARAKHALPCVALVNNLNSTLAHERADVVIPLRCGPEIAVPATKSFINQLTLLYGLAHRLGRRLGREMAPIPDFPALIQSTLSQCNVAVEEAAELLFLTPSMHLLATRLSAVAKEGALKIREVVLNHTEGFEGSEFKHGPNTILGFNTIFGPAGVEALLAKLADQLAERPLAPDEAAALVRDGLTGNMALLSADYPLVFITGPDPRDVDLTISQIHTHKIRGAQVVVVAEENERLRAAAMGVPTGNEHYHPVYIALPTTGDTDQAVFSATVALQLLALSMSERKRAYLDARNVEEHGVHPDVPKNVSKSITVD